MKRIIFFVLISVIFLNARAQVDRSKAPQPGPAPKINIGTYEKFTLKNGLTVIVVENNKVPRVSYSLYIDRDPVREGENAGYVSISGDLLDEGTTNMNKEKLNEEIDFIGGTLSSHSRGVYAASLKKHTEKLLELMSDVLLNPAFPKDELEKLKKQNISSLAAQETNPQAIAGRVANVLRYGKSHPYGEFSTEKTINSITIDNCKKYYETYFKPNASYLVIVGDMNVKEAKSLTKKYFGKWKSGEVPQHNYPTPMPPKKSFVALVDKPGAVQSVLTVTYPLNLKPGSKEEIHADVMNNILGGTAFGSRLMQNLREDKAYTYGAYSRISSDELIGSFSAGASVRNEVTDSAISEIISEMEKLKKESVTEEELNNVLKRMTGDFARSLERPQTIANFALNTELYDLPEDYYATYLQALNNTSVEHVKNAANKFLLPGQSYLLVVGNSSDVKGSLNKIAEVREFDNHGNPVSAEDEESVDITGEEVIEKYIEALGGRKNLEKVKDVVMKYNATAQGANIDLNIYQEKPDKYVLSMFANGTLMIKMGYNGDKGKAVGMQGSKDIEGEDLEKMKKEGALFPELNYFTQESKVNVEVKGTKKINDQKAYEVKITDESGASSTNYYSKETGLLIRTIETEEGPMGTQTSTMDFSNYKEVEGIMFPHTITQSAPMGKIEFKASEVKVNEGIDKDIFKL